MSATAVLLSRVDAVLAQTISDNRARWQPLQSEITDIFEQISTLVLGGGKRLRPQFAYWGWVGAGGDPMADEIPRIGAGIELLHVAALFHDDIIDDAATRRGNVTSHRSFTKHHESAAGSGEARRYGEGITILVGDITYVLSDSLMDTLSPAARSIWHDLRLEMNIGQYLDVLGSAHLPQSVEEADLICRMKSAKYTIERPLHLGAVAANTQRGTALMPMLSAYGLAVGDAFQMRDDILGAYGDAEITGKPVGGDFREGKPTPLLARALQMATPEQKKIISRVGQQDLTDNDVTSIQQAVVATGALQVMEDLIVSLHNQGVAALKKSELQGESFDALIHLASVVTQRSI